MISSKPPAFSNGPPFLFHVCYSGTLCLQLHTRLTSTVDSPHSMNLRFPLTSFHIKASGPYNYFLKQWNHWSTQVCDAVVGSSSTCWGESILAEDIGQNIVGSCPPPRTWASMTDCCTEWQRGLLGISLYLIEWRVPQKSSSPSHAPPLSSLLSNHQMCLFSVLPRFFPFPFIFSVDLF